MKRFGPFSTDASFYPDRTSFWYQVQVGRNGLIEFINLSSFDLQVDLPMGSITIEQRSKSIWRLPEAYQGQVPLTVTPVLVYVLQPITGAQFFANPVAGIASVLWINTYEEGEIEWYPPASLGSAGPGQSFFLSTNTNPPAITIGPFVAYPLSGIYLWGLDVTGNQPTANSAGVISIAGLVSGTWQIELSQVTGVVMQPLLVRWSPPMASTLGGTITLTCSAPMTGANLRTTLYYTVP